MHLVRPAADHLASYRSALERGWSPNTVDASAAAAELRLIDADPAGFLASLDDPEGRGAPIVLPDGSSVPRLPGYRRWMWDDGEVVGSIGVRWQPGTEALPPHVLGHVGYTVVPWARRRGHATAALRELLPELSALGLAYVELVTDESNLPSQKVVVANGGVLVERFAKPHGYGEADAALRWRIDLDQAGRPVENRGGVA